MLAVEVVGVHEEHRDETGLIEVEMKSVGEAGERGEGVLEGFVAALPGLEVTLVVLVLVVVDDLAEVDAGEEVLVGLRHLGEDGVGLHVLDVSLDQGGALLDGLDDLFLAQDCLVDEGILGCVGLASGQVVLGGLLLSEEGRQSHSGHGRQRGREEKRQKRTGDGS